GSVALNGNRLGRRRLPAPPALAVRDRPTAIRLLERLLQREIAGQHRITDVLRALVDPNPGTVLDRVPQAGHAGITGRAQTLGNGQVVLVPEIFDDRAELVVLFLADLLIVQPGPGLRTRRRHEIGRAHV